MLRPATPEETKPHFTGLRRLTTIDHIGHNLPQEAPDAFPGSAAPASVKGAVEVLTKYLAKELGPWGIAVNTVAPSAMRIEVSGGTLI